MTKFLIVVYLYDLIPLAIFGYLLVLLYCTIRKDKLFVKKAFCQTERQQFEIKCTQTMQEKTDSYTEVTQNQFLAKSIQTVVIENDASTLVERRQSNTKCTQNVNEIRHNRHIQTLLLASYNKETQTSPHLCLDKEIQTEIIRNSSEVFLTSKKRKPKPKIPLTKEFVKYHQSKLNLQKSEKKIQVQAKIK
ncbi:hypothetical protein AVEN_270747-1 [Araneus ventricosus]|uniref:Transmembrane protein n=1 Tax=Araneus ventricosus TaxID=182803 RepID=A0A4Y2S0U7_ARAVE|nr:hypothetical protein AVEN_270747-1 [Araneus ventricosus]